MHWEGIEGERKKCYLSKKMKRGGYEGEQELGAKGRVGVCLVLYP